MVVVVVADLLVVDPLMVQAHQQKTVAAYLMVDVYSAHDQEAVAGQSVALVIDLIKFGMHKFMIIP